MSLFDCSKLKRKLRIFLRLLNDFKAGNDVRFATNHSTNDRFTYKISISQQITNTETSTNKISNISIAANKINAITINPNELFSFWKIVGCPNRQNGFKKSRNLIAGKLVEDYGGGLCQLSGIIYHLSLIADLKIVERFNHSVDLYTDNNRYTPLGADATVVYGYKDLRLMNNLSFPIQFRVYISQNTLVAELLSLKSINQQKITFNALNQGEKTIVKTLNCDKKLLATSIYSNL